MSYQVCLFWLLFYSSMGWTASQDWGMPSCAKKGVWINRSHQHLKEIPKDLPESTQYLDLSYNNLTSLNDVDLQLLQNLCFLRLSNNRIRFVSEACFQMNSNLEILDLSHNLLETIPYLPLRYVLGLRVLDISGNLYRSYSLGNTFATLQKMTVLNLGSPHAPCINKKDFTSLHNVTLKVVKFSNGVNLQKYEAGSLVQLQMLEELSINMSFCGKVPMLTAMLRDLNQTKVRNITLGYFSSKDCNQSIDPFRGLSDINTLEKLTFTHSWISSSLITYILPKLGQSNIQVLVFQNITYDDNTGGIYFNGVNGSTRISLMKSVIFDGVTHYQYNYPLIYINLTLFLHIAYVKFSHSGMNISPCNLLPDIISLEVLDVSNNLLDDTGFWRSRCNYTNVFPSLQKLNLSHNQFKNLGFISSKLHQMKVLDTVDLSFNSIDNPDTCSWPAKMTTLILSHNPLGNTVFNCLSKYFLVLDLSYTQIDALSSDALSRLPRLTKLYLTGNFIKQLPSHLEAAHLHTLYINFNSINIISQNMLQGLPQLRQLNAGNNTLYCTCDMYWFTAKFDKNLLVEWPDSYTCNYPSNWAGKTLATYNPNIIICNQLFQALIGVGTGVFMCIVLALLCYCCDAVWYFRMLCMWIHVKRSQSRKSGEMETPIYQFDAFISYSEEDSVWVTDHLLVTLENAAFRICIHKRDFTPGQLVIENIINCIENSYKTIFVLSKQFVKSEWCHYELYFAQHRSLNIQQDSIIFVLLEPIPSNSVPRKFVKLRKLLNRKTYLEWPQEAQKQQIFWSNLKGILETGNKSIVA
eukprot:gi/632961613/ref/XP_007896851.1/ PREDICTED: toll-like receptor 2 [Callorhinchus milii]